MTRLAGCVAALVVSALLVGGGAPAARQPVFNADCNGIPCRVERLAAPWEVVEVGFDLRTLTVVYESGGCWRGPGHVSAREARGRIAVSVEQDRVVAMDTPDGSFACTADLRYGRAVLVLRRRVAGRPIEGVPRLARGALGPVARVPRVVDLRAADARRSLLVQGRRPRLLGRDTGSVAFQSPLPDKRLPDSEVRLTVDRHLFPARALKRCLERAGIPTFPRTPTPGDFDAPDLALWLRHARAMASVALYADPVRATELAPGIRRNLLRIGGVLERRRYVSIAWYAEPAAAPRRSARRCVFGSLGRPRS